MNASLRKFMNALVTVDLARRFQAGADRRPMFPAEDHTFFREARTMARLCINTGAGSQTMGKLVAWLAERHGITDTDERRFLEIGAWEAFIKAIEKVEGFALGREPLVFTEPEPPPPAGSALV